jgi:metal-responsive CopG/Arc/MetJ family transcriptional regulator
MLLEIDYWDMARPVSVSLEDEVAETLDDQLEYGDSRSAIVNAALKAYLGMEDANVQ